MDNLAFVGPEVLILLWIYMHFVRLIVQAESGQRPNIIFLGLSRVGVVQGYVLSMFLYAGSSINDEQPKCNLL